MNRYSLFVLLLLIGSVSGCTTPTRYRGAVRTPRFQTGTANSAYQSTQNNSTVTETSRKIIFSAYLTLSVDNPDTANLKIEKITEKYKGYLSESGTERTIVRVKSDNLEQAVAEISELGKVQFRKFSGKDVTEEFLDYQVRLENAEKARSRYLELLAKAENVEAALLVEKELERLNETIDLLKGKMTRLDHLEEYSTITILLKERKKPGVLGYIGMGFYYSVKWLFVRN